MCFKMSSDLWKPIGIAYTCYFVWTNFVFAAAILNSVMLELDRCKENFIHLFTQ